jgi:PIN domain nuclease of toxin-antitoxin system
MRYLLDTHALIWALQEPDMLSKRAIGALMSPESTVFVSIVSLWEIALKTSTGKAVLVSLDIEHLSGAIAQMGARRLMLDERACIKLAKLPFYNDHGDPFDRMIVSQAIVSSLTLISKDERMAAYCQDGLDLLWH